MKIVTQNVCPPIPSRNFDWQAIDDDTYDGELSPIGHGATEQEAIADLLEQLDACCAHCKKELTPGAVYHRGELLHPECRVPYIVAQRNEDAVMDHSMVAHHESQRAFRYTTGHEDFGGAFDGFHVTSDADEGL